LRFFVTLEAVYYVVCALPLIVGWRPPGRTTQYERLFLLKNANKEPVTHNRVHKFSNTVNLHFQYCNNNSKPQITQVINAEESQRLAKEGKRCWLAEIRGRAHNRGEVSKIHL